MKKELLLLTLIFVLCALLVSSSVFSQATILTIYNPLNINTKEKSVSILAEVNNQHPERTHHGVVFKGGKLDHKAIFAGLADPKAFHESLVNIGLKPGNNMTMSNKEKTFVEGDLLDVFVTWEGAKRIYRLDEMIKDSNGKPLAIRFGGNLVNALKKKTGCLVCLDSCPVGITSNSAYTYGAIDLRNEVIFTANKELLPPDGTLVVIIFNAKK
ncbi:MAG: YdjY domain-containing protein [Proteobacteria bacterium]|nr:YdjY domain-containing protein [Pseudomonadota bacterium]